MFDSDAELLAFVASAHASWRVENGRTFLMTKQHQKKDTIPSIMLLTENLAYATERERIVSRKIVTELSQTLALRSRRCCVRVISTREKKVEERIKFPRLPSQTVASRFPSSLSLSFPFHSDGTPAWNPVTIWPSGLLAERF